METADQGVQIKVLKDGPIHIQGDFTFKHSDGSTTQENELFICRCGGSSNKPFCDDTHQKIGVPNK